MGIRGLSFYMNEHLDVLENYKLSNCNVVIDGKNLAHYLHKECSGINIAFGGDFDKYASFVRKFFEGLRSCGVNALVVMDGGQPLDGKKLKTAQERAEGQIIRCLSIDPENQFSEKVFPPICCQVFVTTLHNMGILVLQTDYEADDEIAALARNLNCIVISEDTDFYMTDVAFVRLSSIAYKNIPKKKFIPCDRFNIESFCEATGVNRSHLALLGTLLANDYVDKEDLEKFHKKVAKEMGYQRPNAGMSRVSVIKWVMQWMARRKKQTVDQIIDEAVGKNGKLRKMILRSVKGYTLQKSTLLDCIPSSIVQTKKIVEGEKIEENQTGSIEYTFDTIKSEVCQKSSQIQTALLMKNGEMPPFWFVKAYRENRIPHEVADILTQGYFFSPVQVESLSSVSSYLVVEPIVRLVYTFLWKECRTEEEKLQLTTKDVDDLTGKYESMNLNEDKNRKPETENNIDMNEMGSLNASTEVTVSNRKSKSKSGNAEEVLCWYIRKKKSLWGKRLNFLTGKIVNQLPSLSEVGAMTISEKKLEFYKMLQMKCESKDQDIPDDLELILNCIIYWFRHTKEELNNCHALTVLVSFFMFYIIDSKIGYVRTWKEFENVDSCSKKLSEMLKDPSYCKPDASAKELVANMSYEECLVAGSALFKYHHIDKTMNRQKYKRNVVHAFSEYQACVYFLQLLNSLLCSPFPFLSIEFLWGGTFGYNVFIDCSGSNDRIAKVAQIFGQGTCLEKLFSMIFGKLEKVLNFSKPPANSKDSKNSKKFAGNSKKFENQVKCAQMEKQTEEVKEVKVKNKAKAKPSNLSNNRFAELMDDSESENDS